MLFLFPVPMAKHATIACVWCFVRSFDWPFSRKRKLATKKKVSHKKDETWVLGQQHKLNKRRGSKFCFALPLFPHTRIARPLSFSFSFSLHPTTRSPSFLSRPLHALHPLQRCTSPPTMEQHFKCGDQVECIDVRQDTQGRFFSQLDDIQDTFPGAARFRVDGKIILFLQDEHGQR